MPAPSLTPEAFIDHWSKAEANERAISQPFLLELTQLLGVPQPSNSHHDGYTFEFPVKVPGSTVTNFIDRHAAAAPATPPPHPPQRTTSPPASPAPNPKPFRRFWRASWPWVGRRGMGRSLGYNKNL